ncbi:unnamed protein product [Scytosiphon promiscuus]
MGLSDVLLSFTVVASLPHGLSFSLPSPQVPCQREWDDYTTHHVGRWRGLWSTYDTAGAKQGDPDRMDTTISLSPDGGTIKHVNTLFIGSVDSECSTCHDSVETRDIPAGQFTKETFRQRASSGCYLSGPGVTRRGDMTTEVGLRLDKDRRIRVLVSHRPVFNGVEPPAQLRLERIVVVREMCALQEQGPPPIDSCWSFDRPSWLGLWRGNAMVLNESLDAGGSLEWTEDTVAPNHLRKCRCSGAKDDDDARALLEFDGGVLLDAPTVVDAGQPAQLSVRWAVGRKSKAVAPDRIVQANVRFEALSRVVDIVRGAIGEDNVRISPPKLLRFSVESLKPVESAGLG